ncbi:hypothetical protein ACFYWU_37660 [Streptomyces chrestomyceticus]|uniref:hypothetical protein n=1 Tax=Streptomyces chrestomyceticus TaxID=68185 RepID=UPI0036C3EED1
MAVDDRAAVPDKSPYLWDEGERERVKRLFRESRPAVPKRVVSALWQYWLQRVPDEAVFGGPGDDGPSGPGDGGPSGTEDDLALLLHARAFGLYGADGDVGAAGTPLAAVAGRAGDLEVCGPLVPGMPEWGPRASLAPEVRAALPSLLVRAWVASDAQGPVEALVVGEGLPEIQQQVIQAALATALRINGLTHPETCGFVSDHLGVGLVRITAGVTGKEPAPDIPSVFDPRSVRVPEGATATARGALRDFVALLRALERDTNLVQVHEVGHAGLVAYTQRFRELATRAAARPDRAFLRPPTGDGPQDPAGLVTLQPSLRTADRDGGPAGTTTGLELSPDLLATDTYTRLEQAHQRVLGERLTLDAKLRRDRLTAEVASLTADLEAFTGATPQERRALWDPTVLLVERFDQRTGRTIRLTEPEEVDTAVYYQENVPRLIKMRQEWAVRMAELIEHLEAAVRRPHAPARQLTAGRFFDAAQRGAVPAESPATAQAFAAWQRDTAPMLWFEWRCALRRAGIDPADLFTPHTVLVTRYLPATEEDRAVLFTHPSTLVDSTRSAVLADAARGVTVVRDATDHAARAEAGPAAADADAMWRDLAALAAEPSQEDAFDRQFLAALRTHPRETVARLLDELAPAPPAAGEEDALDAELRRAESATSVSAGMERALVAMRNRAFGTARECLDGVRGAPQWEARAWLLRAVVECVESGLDHREIAAVLGGDVGVPPEAARALAVARRLDEEFPDAWLADLARPEHDVNKGIRRLFQGLPKVRTSCGERGYAVLLFRRAVQSVRLARELEAAGEELSEHQEAVDVALVKLGRVLEDILVGPHVGSSRGAAEELFEILTGQEQPKYGRVGVR